MKLRKESDVDVDSLSDEISKNVEQQPQCNTRSVIESPSVKVNMNDQDENLSTNESKGDLINNKQIVNPSVFCDESGEDESCQTYMSIGSHLNHATSEECKETQATITATPTPVDFNDDAEKTLESTTAFDASIELVSVVKQPDLRFRNTILDLLKEFEGKKLHLRRVKFYEADNECSQWEEKGIGVVHLVPVKSYLEDIRFYVTNVDDSFNEANSKMLLDTTILKNEGYCLQNKRLITWLSAPKLRCLSFVKQSSCSILWSLLQLLVPERIEDEGDEYNYDNQPLENDDTLQDETTLTPVNSLKYDECKPRYVETQENQDRVGNNESSVLHLCVTNSDAHDYSSTMNNFDYMKQAENQMANSALLNSSSSESTTSPHLLDQYDDASLHQTFDTHDVDQTNTSSNNNSNMFPSLPIPYTSDILTDCLSDIHILERNAISFPCEVSQALTSITEMNWLSALWDLLDRGIKASDELLCSSIAEFLWRVVYIYFHRSNPFLSLSVSQDGERFLESWDPLVRLLSDVHYIHFFRAMEYETELRKHSMTISHVDFLEKAANFKQVICRGDETFRTTCHFIYRLIYLRDVCLPRHLDDQTLQRVNSIINAGYAYLCRIIYLTSNSIRELRDMILEDPTAARFLHQLLCIFRSSTDLPFSVEKYRIFGTLRSERVIEALEFYLTGTCTAVQVWWKSAKLQKAVQQHESKCMENLIINDSECRYRNHILSHGRPTILSPSEIAVEILYLVVECRPAILRSAFLRQNLEHPEEGPTFWYSLCDVLHKTDNEGLQIQIMEMFKKLLDPVSMESPERDDFLGLFYDKGVLDRLINILLTPAPSCFNSLYPPTSATQNKKCDLYAASLYPYYLSGYNDSELMCCEQTNEPFDEVNSKKRLVTLYDHTDHTWKHVPQPISPADLDADKDKNHVEYSLLPDNFYLYRKPQKIRDFLAQLNNSQKEQVLSIAKTQLSFLKCRITEILSFCVIKHSSRIKYRNFQQNLHLHIIKMSCEPYLDPFLAVCAVKFLRACLSAESEHYARIFIRHNIFRPILNLLKSSLITYSPSSRCEGSLLESVLLEFFNFLSTSIESSPSIASLVKCLFERYSQECQELIQFYRDVCQFELFNVLKTQYNELLALDKRALRADSFDSQSYFSDTYLPISQRSLRSRNLPQYNHQTRSTHKISSEDVEREMEDLYFQLDDEMTDPYSTVHKAVYEKDEDQSEAPFNTEKIHPRTNPDDILQVPSFPHFNSNDDDESDVPSFLKSPSSSFESSESSQPNIIKDDAIKQNLVNIKIQLHSSISLQETKEA